MASELIPRSSEKKDTDNEMGILSLLLLLLVILFLLLRLLQNRNAYHRQYNTELSIADSYETLNRAIVKSSLT